MVTEEELIRRIEIVNNSAEIENIVEEIQNNTKNMGAYLVEHRIKSEKSALDSMRNNKVKAEVSKDLYRTVGMTNPSTIESFKCVDTVVDLLALRIITNTADDMYKIKNYLKQKYNPFIIIDGINEPLIGFEYRAIHMYFKIKLEGIDFDVPMEIQLKTYEMHHAWFGLHDAVYKNDNINLYDGCTLLPILFKIYEFNIKILKKIFDGYNGETDFTAIDCIIQYNQKLFRKYEEDLKKGCFLVAKSIYYDRNKDSKVTEGELLKAFEKLVENNSLQKETKLHLYGDSNVDFAVYCIATNNFEELV